MIVLKTTDYRVGAPMQIIVPCIKKFLVNFTGKTTILTFTHCDKETEVIDEAVIQGFKFLKI